MKVTLFALVLMVLGAAVIVLELELVLVIARLFNSFFGGNRK